MHAQCRPDGLLARFRNGTVGFFIKGHGLLFRIHDDFQRERRLFLGDYEILRTGNENHAESVFDRFSVDGGWFRC